MSTTIKLTTNFLRRAAGSDEYRLPASVKTMADLLRHLGQEESFPFIDAEGSKPRPDIEVTLNQKDIAFYPSGLETPLSLGDWVDISLTPLGGG